MSESAMGMGMGAFIFGSVSDLLFVTLAERADGFN
jgi:hypothetical protein